MHPTTPWIAVAMVILIGFYIIYHKCPSRQRTQTCSLDRPSKRSALVVAAVGVAIFIAEIAI